MTHYPLPPHGEATKGRMNQKDETSLDRPFTPCEGLGADLANHAESPNRSTEDQIRPIKNKSPPKESTTPSGPRGLHPTGGRARTHHKPNVLLFKKMRHAHEQASEPPNKYQSTSLEGSRATVGGDN
jgi:hypothetical protein